MLFSLEIDHDVAPPFTPECKPFIERGFGTFSHDLLELCAGYIGHSVAERKDIEARRSFAQRLMKQGETIEMRMSPEELQQFCDEWTENIYGIAPHSGLNGRSPFEMAAGWTGTVRSIDDERALDVLLSEAPGDGGFRTISVQAQADRARPRPDVRLGRRPARRYTKRAGELIITGGLVG